MRTARFLVLSVSLLTVLSIGGCSEEGSPTEPTGGLNLNGEWTGTIADYDSPACAREGIAVVVAQEGTSVLGSFRTSCQGMLEIRGQMNGGSSVSGELHRVSDRSTIGQISGTASRRSIHIVTSRPLPREDDGPRARAIVNVIDLTR